MKKIFYLSLCFMNFLPLWIVVVWRDIRSIYTQNINLGAEWCGVIGCACGTLIALSVVILGLLGKKKQSYKKVVLKTALEEKSLTLEVLLTYMFPLLTFDFRMWTSLVEFLIFFALVSFLTIRHNLITGNVFLELLGYRIYSCKFSNRTDECYLLARRYLGGEEGSELMVATLNDEVEVMFEQKRDNK